MALHPVTQSRSKGEGKVVPVFFSNSVPRHEGVLGELCSSTHSLISSLDGGE